MLVPDSHRAAALRLAYARLQQASGRSVWTTPEVHTWEAWVGRAWRAAQLQGRAPDAQLLSLSQERALWQDVLAGLPPEGDDLAALGVHAAGLMRAAARAAQSLLDPVRSAATREERLLADALAGIRAQCAQRGLVSLSLLSPDSLEFLRDLPPPAVVGVPRLTPLQQALQQRCWPGESLLLPLPSVAGVAPLLRRAPHLEGEVAACAQWCRAHLQRDPSARLLVTSVGAEPSLRTLSVLLWRALAPQQRDDPDLRDTWLAMEGGEPLAGQALIDDALAALSMQGAWIETARLLALLRSPVLAFGTPAQCQALRQWLEARGIARWSHRALLDALGVAAATEEPAAAALLAWFAQLEQLLVPDRRESFTVWAERFSAALAAAGFGTQRGLGSRQQQRLARWRELLDELAAMDAVLPPVRAGLALACLRELAVQGRHQGASRDAAITLAAGPGDPVIDYDGIWVLGLVESQWPPQPRPDPYVSLAEQRRCQWPEAGVAQSRAQARWLLDCWQRRGGELVLSHAEYEGDVHRRPTGLLPGAAEEWLPVVDEDAGQQAGAGALFADASLLPVQGEAGRVLPGGVERLRLQRDCPFRAQAQYRLGARPPETLTEGISAALRGRVLHGVMQRLWDVLGTQAALLALGPAEESSLLQRCWEEALAASATDGARWLPAPVLRRERQRTLRVVARVLELERQRPPFTAEYRERAMRWEGGAAGLRLRIDRIDRTADGRRVLIDYKSGATSAVRLHEGELEPLQLALYVAVLAAQGESVDAALLLALRPAGPESAGVSRDSELLPMRLKLVEDWDRMQQAWMQALEQLLQTHLAGEAQLAARPAVCRHCHLDSLCRRAPADAVEPDDE